MKTQVTVALFAMAFATASFAGTESFVHPPEFQFDGVKESTYNYRGNESFPNTPNFKYEGENASTYNYRGNESFPNTPNFKYDNAVKASDTTTK